MSEGPVPSQAETANGPRGLSDEEWQRIESLLPQCGGRGGQWKDHRQIIDGILWVLTTGAAWRELPERFGNWKTVYERYRRWEQTGFWRQIEECLASRIKGESESRTGSDDKQ